MRLLAIETSCDETAIAIVEYNNSRGLTRINTRTNTDEFQRQSAPARRSLGEGGSSLRKSAFFKVLANLVSSQVKIHEKFGGVVPNLTRREHEKNLVPILIKALKEAGLYGIMNNESRIIRPKTIIHNSKFMIPNILEREIVLQEKFIKYVLPHKKPNIDVIAVTYGPGLAPALWTGVNFAKALSALWQIPLIPVNHMEGHIFSALLRREDSDKRHATSNIENASGYSPARLASQCEAGRLVAIRYPAIALLVSGGHTELHLIKKLGSYRRLGETLDDAAGEAFDKVAKMMNLGYPGGPEISKQAKYGNPHAIQFPRPMLKTNNFDFSFSGLKTSVLYYLRDHKNFSIPDVAASFEEAAVEVLIEKTLHAAKKYKAKTILIGGGVAANKKLRAALQDKITQELPTVKFLTPQLAQTGDNALMIALAAGFGSKKKTPKKIGAEPGLRL